MAGPRFSFPYPLVDAGQEAGEGMFWDRLIVACSLIAILWSVVAAGIAISATL